MEDEDIARIIHGAQLGYQYVLKDPCPALPWDCEHDYIRQALIEAVAMLRAGASPRQIHQRWMEGRRSLGWAWGPGKDYQADPPTHPCLLDWDELPAHLRAKDEITWALVRVLAEVEVPA